MGQNDEIFDQIGIVRVFEGIAWFWSFQYYQKSNFNMEMYEICTKMHPLGSRLFPKNSFLGLGPGTVSYRLSYK
jgi:hypothetical protein